MKSKQFLVLGLGRFGASLAKTLCDLGRRCWPWTPTRSWSITSPPM